MRFQSLALLLSIAFLASACGGNSLPNVGTLARNIPPALSTSSLAAFEAPKHEILQPFSAVRPFLTYATDGWTANLSQLETVFGTNMSGVNTQMAVQFAQLETLFNEIGSGHYSESAGFINCTEAVSSQTAGAPTSAFPDDAIFWAASHPDAGKYSCLVTKTVGSYTYQTLLGREARTEAATNCQAVNNYHFYIVNAYSTGTSTEGGYQLQRIYMNGCTRELKLAMSMARTSTTLTNNFGARIELVGNPDTHNFQVRLIKVDRNDAGLAGMLIESAGVSRTSGSTTGYFPARIRACSGGDASTCNPSGTDKLMCIQAGTTAGSYSQVAAATSTECDAHTTAYNAVGEGSNGFDNAADVNRTWIDFSTKAAFGL